jgi:general secretion pathway protein E
MLDAPTVVVPDVAVPGEVLRNLPFAFARRHGIVLRERLPDLAICALRHDANPGAIAEARRALRVPLKLERVSDEEFDRLLRTAYEGSAGALAMAGGDLTENADLEHLAQELPEQADLLDNDIRVRCSKC